MELLIEWLTRLFSWRKTGDLEAEIEGVVQEDHEKKRDEGRVKIARILSLNAKPAFNADAKSYEWARSGEIPPEFRDERRVKMILDTDIGSDIDDALALLMLLRFPVEDVDLLGVTTVYGIPSLRAAVAKRIIEEAGRSEPVYVGESTPIKPSIFGRPWVAGVEGIGVLHIDQILELVSNPSKSAQKSSGSPTPAWYETNHSNRTPSPRKFAARITEMMPDQQRGVSEAVDFIEEQVRKYPGEVTIVSVGALSNLYQALVRSPDLENQIHRVVFMGTGVVHPKVDIPAFEDYEFGKAYVSGPCHNVRQDFIAAARVFADYPNLSIWAVPHHVTHRAWLKGFAVRALRNAGNGDNGWNFPPESALVGKMLDVWLEYRSESFLDQVLGTCPHDPLTVHEAVYPGRLLRYVRGRIVVHETNYAGAGRGPGWTSFFYDPVSGHHWVAVDWKKGGDAGPAEFERFLSGCLIARDEESRSRFPFGEEIVSINEREKYIQSLKDRVFE